MDGLVRSLAPRNKKARRAWFQLIDVIRQRSSALNTQAFQHHNQSSWHTQDFLKAVAAMTYRFGQRVRSPWDWTCDGQPIQSLSNHLFAEYPVAAFLHRGWLESEPAQSTLIAIGSGQSVKAAVCTHFDVLLSRKSAHLFANGSDRFGVRDTLRWSQLQAAGCEDKLAVRILRSTSRFEFPHDFWLELSSFLQKVAAVEPGRWERSIVAPDFAEMQAIARFAYEQKFGDPSRVLGYRTLSDEPLQDDFTLRGRTLRSLRNHMENWRNEVNLPPRHIPKVPTSWAAAGPKPMEFRFGQSQWHIIEITDVHELRREGLLMHHCVATYHRDCAHGASSIWSLRQQTGDRTTPKVTIEYRPLTKKITQAKACHNQCPNLFQTTMIRSWAAENGIGIEL